MCLGVWTYVQLLTITGSSTIFFLYNYFVEVQYGAKIISCAFLINFLMVDIYLKLTKKYHRMPSYPNKKPCQISVKV